MPSPNTLINGTNNSLSSSTPTKNNHITSTPYSESKLRIPTIHSNNFSLIKSASTSDIPLATKVQLDATTMSESEAMKVIYIDCCKK